MAGTKEDLHGYFGAFSPNGLLPDVLAELESILRLHSISAQELFYKWESYSLKMGSEETKFDLDTVRMFKKDVQDGLERGQRAKHSGRVDRRSAVAATPRHAANGDVFGMYGPKDPPHILHANHLPTGSMKSIRTHSHAEPEAMAAGRNEKPISSRPELPK